MDLDRRSREGMLNILRCKENSGIKSGTEFKKLLKSASFFIRSTSKNHLMIYDPDERLVLGRGQKPLVFPPDMKPEIYRDTIRYVSQHIRANYTDQLVNI